MLGVSLAARFGTALAHAIFVTGATSRAMSGPAGDDGVGTGNKRRGPRSTSGLDSNNVVATGKRRRTAHKPTNLSPADVCTLNSVSAACVTARNLDQRSQLVESTALGKPPQRAGAAPASKAAVLTTAPQAVVSRPSAAAPSNALTMLMAGSRGAAKPKPVPSNPRARAVPVVAASRNGDVDGDGARVKQCDPSAARTSKRAKKAAELCSDFKGVHSQRVRNGQGSMADRAALATYEKHSRDEDSKQPASLATEAQRTAAIMVKVASRSGTSTGTSEAISHFDACAVVLEIRAAEHKLDMNNVGLSKCMSAESSVQRQMMNNHKKFYNALKGCKDTDTVNALRAANAALVSGSKGDARHARAHCNVLNWTKQTYDPLDAAPLLGSGSPCVCRRRPCNACVALNV